MVKPKLSIKLSQLLRSIVQKNLKNLEDCLSYAELAYNKTVHSSTNYSPFKVLYGFNPLTPNSALIVRRKLTLQNTSKQNLKFVQNNG